ncbi:TIGR03013 family PEP-CTERM/XrtA system glycosyltransferase [Desulfatiferula olefinivorans]
MLRFFRHLYTIRNVFFILGEASFIYVAVLVSSWILMGPSVDVLDKWLNLRALVISFVCIVCLYYNSVYDISVTRKYSELTIRLMQAFGAALIILAGIYALFQDVMICRGFFLIYLPIVMGLIALWRFLYMTVLHRGILNQRILLLGSSDISQGIVSTILEQIDCGYTLVAVAEEKHRNKTIQGLTSRILRLEGYDNLYQKARAAGIDKIVVAIKERRGAFPLDELLTCRVEGLEIVEGNSFYEMLTGKLIVSDTNPTWFIFSEGFRKTWIQTFIKRVEDIVASMILIAVFLPVVLATAVLIKLESTGPVLFSQERLGKRKKPYRIYKFRSMRQDAEKESGPVWAKANDDRVTRVGKFIRKWRVDEIPQLWNVLKGDMSLVGPRPERDHFIKQLSEQIPYYSERFCVKPGLTGWAQVCYGYGDSIEDAVEKLNYDLFYIKNLSIFMDIVIIFRTVKTVIFGVGAR